MASLAAILSLLLAPAEVAYVVIPSAMPEKHNSEDSSSDEFEDALVCQAAARRSMHRPAEKFAAPWLSRTPVAVSPTPDHWNFDRKLSLRNLSGTPLRI